ncbi:hypothetical protein K239x_13030 [Planctomycetes bacterium K23_9]|uniref:Uncharacterized protein n=1 Tax=Stieleria marina TaxID=1930275 RepID=A0A517NQF7_9BACT|nr:hypothetical protein K239x_13030 [Planctomycetes bacterium K23_9]
MRSSERHANKNGPFCQQIDVFHKHFRFRSVDYDLKDPHQTFTSIDQSCSDIQPARHLARQAISRSDDPPLIGRRNLPNLRGLEYKCSRSHLESAR